MSVLTRIRKTSQWTFKSSSTAGLSVGIASASGGFVDLVDPSGNDVRMNLGIVGAGASFAVKLPVVATIAGSAMPSQGHVYIMDSFEGDELSRADLSGVCYAVDAAVGIPALDVSGTVLLAGISLSKAAADRALWITYPLLAMFKEEVDLLFESSDPLYICPKALIIMGGPGVATLVGVAASGYLGYMG